MTTAGSVQRGFKEHALKREVRLGNKKSRKKARRK